MTFKPTILNVVSGLFMVGVLLYTLFNYSELSKGEGWGVVSMFGLLGVGLLLLLVDFVIQQIFRNKKT